MVYFDGKQAIAHHVQSHFVACGDANCSRSFTHLRGDDAVVGDLRSDQDAVAAGGVDAAVVDDVACHAARVIGFVEDVTTGEEVGIFDIEGGADEGTGVDLGTGTHQDAVLVHQKYTAIGRKGTEDFGSRIADDAV